MKRLAALALAFGLLAPTMLVGCTEADKPADATKPATPTTPAPGTPAAPGTPETPK